LYKHAFYQTFEAQYAAIIHNIKDLLAKDWSVKVVHTFREDNACADYLAKLKAHNPKVYSPVAIPPSGMSLLLMLVRLYLLDNFFLFIFP
jgi:hypothetical protein